MKCQSPLAAADIPNWRGLRGNESQGLLKLGEFANSFRLRAPLRKQRRLRRLATRWLVKELLGRRRDAWIALQEATARELDKLVDLFPALKNP